MVVVVVLRLLEVDSSFFKNLIKVVVIYVLNALLELCVRLCCWLLGSLFLVLLKRVELPLEKLEINQRDLKIQCALPIVNSLKNSEDNCKASLFAEK